MEGAENGGETSRSLAVTLSHRLRRLEHAVQRVTVAERPDPEKIAHVKRASRIATVGWGLLFVAVGFGCGWWAGSATACRSGGGCEARIAAIETVGTWVGGLGTVGALLLAVSQLSEARSGRERLAVLEGRAIAFRTAPRKPDAGKFTKIEVLVKNSSQSVVQDLELYWGGTRVGGAHQLRIEREFSAMVPVASISAIPDLHEAELFNAYGSLKREFDPKLEMRFKIDGYKFSRRGEEFAQLG